MMIHRKTPLKNRYYLCKLQFLKMARRLSENGNETSNTSKKATRQP